MCDRMIGPYRCCSVVCGDCLELMRSLPDGCVDAVINVIESSHEPAIGQRAAQYGCGDNLGESSQRNRNDVSRSGDVADRDCEALRNLPVGVSEGAPSSRDSSEVSRQAGRGERSLHQREAEQAIPQSDGEESLQSVWNGQAVTDSPQGWESFQRRANEFGSVVLPVPYKPPQAGVLAKEEIAIVSDPPYGISLNTRTLSTQRGRHANKGFRGHDLVRDFAPVHGDDAPFNPAPFLKFNRVILWGANHYADKLPPAARWLIWDKRCGSVSDDNADCEMAWTNLRGQARVFSQYWRGWLREGEENLSISGPKLHPTQKPERLMRWCIEHIPENAIILDPFCGSGTTLVAAKKLGRHYLGFELEPRYVEISRDRLARIEAQPSLFETKPEQMTFGDGT